MTWTQIDDGLNFSPQTMPGTVSNAALGLWVRLCVHTAYQLRFPAFDGAFDITVVRSLKGNARQVTELEAAGMLEPALAAGRWMVVEADTLMKFGGTSGSELKEKRAKAGHAGGVASGESRRSKREANASKQNEASTSSKPRSKTEANHEAKDEANGEAKPKQTSEAKRSNCFEANEATGPNLTIPSLTSPVAPSAPNAEPSQAVAESGHARPVPSLAEAEALAEADPFAFAWDRYPSHTGSRDQAQNLWQAVTSGSDPTMPQAEPSQLLGAVIRYAQTVRQDGRPARAVDAQMARKPAIHAMAPKRAETHRMGRRHPPMAPNPRHQPSPRRLVDGQRRTDVLGPRQNRRRAGDRGATARDGNQRKASSMSDQPTAATLRLVEGRENNRCIVCDRYLRNGEWPGSSHHHRKRRSQTYGDPERHAPSNVIDVCGTDNSTGCHGWIHQHPEQARALGYLLKSYDPEPSQVPVYSCRRGWILLDTDGQWHSCPPPEDLPTHINIKKGNE